MMAKTGHFSWQPGQTLESTVAVVQFSKFKIHHRINLIS